MNIHILTEIATLGKSAKRSPQASRDWVLLIVETVDELLLAQDKVGLVALHQLIGELYLSLPDGAVDALDLGEYLSLVIDAVESNDGHQNSYLVEYRRSLLDACFS
jgi:hypothetical protein